MIYEHLIEPSLLAKLAQDRRNCKDFVRQFSEPSPRVISNFPKFKSFRKLAYNALSIDDSENTKQRLDELILFVKEAHRVERTNVFSGEISWHENVALASKSCFADYALVERQEPEYFSGKIIRLKDFEEGLDDLQGQAIVEKEVGKMVGAFGNLLRLSQDITFVDPYFSDNPKVWEVFIALVSEAVKDAPCKGTSITVLYSAEKANLPAPSHLLNKFERENPHLFDDLDRLEFITLESKADNEDLHNRYLITELAGLSLGFGFDARGEGQTDDVSILGKELYETRYKQYVEMEAFTLVNKVSKIIRHK